MHAQPLQHALAQMIRPGQRPHSLHLHLQSCITTPLQPRTSPRRKRHNPTLLPTPSLAAQPSQPHSLKTHIPGPAPAPALAHPTVPAHIRMTALVDRDELTVPGTQPLLKA